MNTQDPAGKLLARVPVPVRWRDLDAFNHVNNSTFLTYLEEARLHWLSGIEGTWHDATMKPVLASAHVDFRRPIEWPGGIVVELSCARLGRSSLTIAHRIVSVESGHLHSDGHVVVVWIDPANGRSVALPAAIRDACT